MLAAAADAEAAAEQRRRDDAAKEERARDLERAREAAEGVLVRVDGTQLTLEDVGAAAVSSLPDGTPVWHDGTNGLAVRRVAGVWAVRVVTRQGSTWRVLGDQVHTLADVARALRKPQ